MARQSSSQTSDTSHATTMSSLLSSDWGDSDDPDYSESDSSSSSNSSWSSNVDFSGGATGGVRLGRDLTKVPNGSIYYFSCQGGFYKVGMTKRDIEVRLKEHVRKPDTALRPRQRGQMIKVLPCDNVREAERRILRDRNTPEPARGREYFRTDISGVVDRVVEEVNSRPNRISQYELNAANKIVRVPM